MNTKTQEALKIIDKTPSEFRLCRQVLKSGYQWDIVLQGLFYWTDNNGNNGADWINIPTVIEVLDE